LIPMIKLFGESLTQPLFPATKLISELSLHEIWRNYVLYIGAGAVAAGGIISLCRSLPTIVRSAAAGLGNLKTSGLAKKALSRVEQDISIKYVLVGCAFLIIAIWLAPMLNMNLLGACLIIVFGFLFVTVSSRITGEIGSSSNPISGMTIATLLVTSLIFLALGWVSPADRVTALSVAAVVCIAASNGGTTAQDLKTGYLVGATPRAQQIGLLFGALTSAVVIGYTLNLLNDASTVYSQKNLPTAKIEDVSALTQMEAVYGPEGAKDKNLYHVFQLSETPKVGPLALVQPGKYLVDDSGSIKYLVDPGINGALNKRDDGSPVMKYEAPKARLMSLIIDGILSRKLPWGLVLLGVSIAIVLELCGVASLPFAVGVYLPLSSSAPIFFGGLIRYLVDRRSRKNKGGDEDSESSPGVLFSSGLIAGGSIAGIGLAILLLKEGWGQALDFSTLVPAMTGSDWTSVIVFTVMALVLYRTGR
ncbi:MAG: OPT/YSL family transporter, partial [Bdellovibrio sp.]|nr:OPT/YSL family transporter [Bdellovibrio sp.]